MLLATDQEVVQAFLDLMNRYPSKAMVGYSGVLTETDDPDFADHKQKKYGVHVSFRGGVDFYFTEGKLTKAVPA